MRELLAIAACIILAASLSADAAVSVAVGQVRIAPSGTVAQVAAIAEGMRPLLQEALGGGSAIVSHTRFEDATFFTYSLQHASPGNATATQVSIELWGVSPTPMSEQLGNATLELAASQINLPQDSVSVKLTNHCRWGDAPLELNESQRGCESIVFGTFYTSSNPQNFDPRELLCNVLFPYAAKPCAQVVISDPGRPRTDGPFGFQFTAALTHVDVTHVISEILLRIEAPRDPLFASVGLSGALFATADRSPVLLSATMPREQPAFDPDEGLQSCAEALWYLVFLLLIIPALIVAMRQAYARGKKKGIIRAKEDLEEMLARVELQKQKMQQQQLMQPPQPPQQPQQHHQYTHMQQYHRGTAYGGSLGGPNARAQQQPSGGVAPTAFNFQAGRPSRSMYQ